MANSRLSTLVLAEVKRTPAPRQVPWTRLAVASYLEPSTLLILGLSAVPGFAFVYSWLSPGPDYVRLIALLLTGAATAWLLCVPLLNAFHYASVIRKALLADAEVVAVAYVPPREVTGKSIKALKNGVARGEVSAPSVGSGRYRFESDDPWAKELRPGTRLVAVIDVEAQEVRMLSPLDR